MKKLNNLRLWVRIEKEFLSAAIGMAGEGWAVRGSENGRRNRKFDKEFFI